MVASNWECGIQEVGGVPGPEGLRPGQAAGRHGGQGVRDAEAQWGRFGGIRDNFVFEKSLGYLQIFNVLSFKLRFNT